MIGIKAVALNVAAVVAVIAIAGIGASPALAALEGPFYKKNGVRLASGGSEGIEVKATSKNYVLNAVLESNNVTITCTGLKFAAGATIIGSTGGNAGESKEQLELTGCSQTGNGASCTVANNTITTKVLRNVLGYSEATRKGKINVLYKPESGTEIAKVVFAGTCNTLSLEAILSGTLAAELLSKDATIEVGKEPEEAEIQLIHFPSSLIKNLLIETGGTVKNEAISLTWGGKTACFANGQSELWLMRRENWGLFTQ